ncbi:presenilin-1-like isoform X2 [Watersipora subatra]|uniref:presenilin-1-like isoform X2 n=1 Tax=Watersipora subatra TaxID=2589382 RepID=UPI00355BB4E3
MADKEKKKDVKPPESYKMEELPRRMTGGGMTEMTEEEIEEELELLYGAKHVILIFIPVGLCMSVVIATISSVDFYTRDDGQYLIYTPFHPAEGDTGGKTLVKSLLNSLILIGVVVALTFFLVLAYKYRCNKLLHGWVLTSSMLIMFMFGATYAQEVLKAYNIPMDIFTAVICFLNFGAVGICSIHWKGPLKLQQAYLIIDSALMSLIFIKYLPEWTLWLVLGLLAIWDLIAVLTPHGPLKMLVEIASERGEQVMPALIYSSTIMYPIVTMAKGKSHENGKTRNSQSKTPNRTPESSKPVVADNPEDDVPTGSKSSAKPPTPAADEFISKEEEDSKQTPSPANLGVNVNETAEETTTAQEGPGVTNRRTSERIAQLEQDIEEADEKGVKLGLGDFIFYSVLVGKSAASGEPTIIIASTVAILMGLFLTLVILVIARKALPALPISIAFGLLFTFGTRYFIVPMVDELSSNQIFI